MENNQKAYQIFSSFKSKYYDDKNEEGTSKDGLRILDIDEEMKIIIQRINKKSKKSTTTRIKALQRMHEILKDKHEGYFEGLIKLFVIVYEKIVTSENDISVLGELQKCLEVFIEKGDKAIKRNFSLIFPYIYFSSFELNKDVSTAARANLSRLLKDDSKIAKALFMFKEKYLALVHSIFDNPEQFIKDMGIYDEKEVNEIIYKKLLAMVWWSLARTLQLAKNLPQEEQEQLVQQVFEATLQSPEPLALKMFSQYKNDYVVRTSLLNFLNILFTVNYSSSIDKIVIKKIVQAVAVSNLDDPNLSFQTFLWKDGFVVRLLEVAKILKIDFGPIKKRFVNVVENHAFGAEQGYYQNLDAALEIFLHEENSKGVEEFFKEIILAHFCAVLKDDLRFEVGAHYKAGFSLLSKQLQKIKKTNEEQAKVDEGSKKLKSSFDEVAIVKDVLSTLINLFFTHNNSTQKNLNVLSVNNIKHFPLHLCEFFEECFASKVSNSFFDAVIEEYRALVTAIFKENLSNRNLIANVAIFVKYFEKLLISSASSSDLVEPRALDFYAKVIHFAFKLFIEAYREKLANLEDNSFTNIIKELESLTAFVDEACEEGFFSSRGLLFAHAVGLQGEFENFLINLQQDYLNYIINDKVDMYLIDPSNKESFFTWMNEFIKAMHWLIDYEPILQAYASEVSKSLSGKLAEKLWHKALVFSVERSIAKKKEEFAKVFDAADPRNTSTLFALKSSKNHSFISQIQKLSSFELFLRRLTSVFLHKDQLQFSVPILVYCENDQKSSLNIVAGLFIEYWQSLAKDTLSPSDIFKMKLNMILVPMLHAEQFISTIEALRILIQGLSLHQSHQIITFFVEDLLQLEQARILHAYEHLLMKSIHAKGNIINLKSIMKQLSQSIHRIESVDFNMELESIFDRTLLSLFGKSFEFGWNQESGVDVLRVAMIPVNNLDWQRVFRSAFTDASVQKSQRLCMLTNLVCQPSVISNYTSNKRRIFWSSFVYDSVMSYIVNLYNKNISDFEEVFQAILEQSFNNTYLIVFVKRFLKQFLKDDSFDVTQKKRFMHQLMDHFIHATGNLSGSQDAVKLQSIAFNYRELISGLSLTGIVGFDEWHLWQDKLETDTFGLFALINSVINQKLDFNSPLSGLKGSTKESEEAAQKAATNALSTLVDKARAMAETQIVRPIGLSLYLELISIVLEKHEEAILATNSEILETYLIEILALAETNFSSQFSQNCFYQFLVLIRKLINVLEMFSENFENNVLKKISKYTFFLSKHAKSSQTLQFWTIPPEEFFNEIAETIARFALREISDVSIEEVFQVLEIDINCLKKSAFYLLQQFKKPFEFDREVVEAVSRGDIGCEAIVSFFPSRMQVVLLDAAQTDIDIFTYFLYWTFALRLCNGQTESSKQKFFLFSTLFNDNPKICQNLLTSLFTFFKNKKLNEREIFTLLDRADFLTPEVNWGDFINEQTKETFGVHLIFLFASLFPKNLRKWIEEEKKLANIAVVFLNYKINQAIFAKEIEKIELTQHEWKTLDFDIFVYKNTREITAVYFKDDNRLEVSLRIPDNYPVKLIDVSLSREAKITEAKAQKWILMIKKMLTNQNYSIVDALVMWKNNIEKEFEGIEDCAICYCIIHTTSKKLPTMPCKTCKKKFHSDCIHKWFQTSQKSECPLCKSQFL